MHEHVCNSLFSVTAEDGKTSVEVLTRRTEESQSEDMVLPPIQFKTFNSKGEGGRGILTYSRRLWLEPKWRQT
jgi:hypothetical protein